MAFTLDKPIKQADEVVCKMQRGAFMTKAWCKYIQCKELCNGCPENEGLDKSRYQQKKAGNGEK